MGQIAHAGRARRATPGRRARAGLALTGLAAGGVLTGCSSSVASAPTILQGVVAATVVHADGSTVGGYDGLKLAPGDVVHTAPNGRAELVTRNRVVYLGSEAADQVVNGEAQSLRAGAVVVDAMHGPGLDLRVAGLDVSAPSGSGVRAERSVLVRIAALAGHADVTSSTGRRLTVAALHQAMTGGDALPDSTTPLQLTDDYGEAQTVPDLVRDDETLNGLARGIDSVGQATFRVVTAALQRPLAPSPPGIGRRGRSEKLLPAVIAAAGPSNEVTNRYDTAVADREAGGSWGVVAHLVGVRASGVVAALAAFERTQPNGQIGSVRAVLASVSNPDRGNGNLGNGPGTHGNGNNGDNGNNGGANGGPSGTPSPSPTPNGPLKIVGKTVGKTVNKVIGLLPTPPPTLGPLPLPSIPLPKITVPGLPTILP